MFWKTLSSNIQNYYTYLICCMKFFFILCNAYSSIIYTVQLHHCHIIRYTNENKKYRVAAHEMLQNIIFTEKCDFYVLFIKLKNRILNMDIRLHV